MPSATTLRVMPFDHATAMAMPDWREHLRWPVSFADIFHLGEAQLRGYLAWVNGLSESGDRDIALQAGVRCLALCRIMAEVALSTQNEAAHGIRLEGTAPELARLRGEPHEGMLGWQQFIAENIIPVPNHLLLRRMARIASWTPWYRMPAALVAPSAVAISHNTLLCADARDRRIGFRHGEAMLAEGHRRIAGQTFAAPEHLVAGATDALCNLPLLDDTVRQRLAHETRQLLTYEFGAARRDLAAAATLRDLPRHLWSATGGKPAARAIGLEVIRRGGHVTRFDHGGSTPLVEVIEPTVLGELSVSTEFVVGTKASAQAVEAMRPERFTSAYRHVTVRGLDGDPGLARLPLTSDRRPTRRKVVYASTILRGFRQYHPPLLADPVYLDWQLRLAEMMQAMPIDLLCKPHPEGLLRGQVHPLAAVAPTSAKRFEEVMAEADVFVFDYWQSTTVSEALCTDRPVVLLDMGNPLFTPEVRAMAERRCRIVRVRFDDRNLPQVDAGELEQALCGGSDRADPSEFHHLLR